jgi:integrase
MPGGSAHRPGYVLAVLGRFGSAQGWGPAPPLGPPVVEAFVVAGLAGRASSTKGTYRSVLRSLGGSARPERATPFSGSPAQAPYSGKERQELFAIAAAQRQAWRRRSALALLALGLGAGLRAGELAAATGDDVVIGQSGVAVRVGMGAGRVVAVPGAYAPALATLAKDAGTGYLFCPGGADRAYKNFVNNFCYNLEADPAAPRFSSGRARSSFICDHLAAGTPLRELLYISGICEVESLLRYARHVPGAPRSKAELRKRLRSV